MNWGRKVYAGASVKAQLEQVRQEMEEGRCRTGLYVITSSYNGKDQLDIRPARSLMKEPLREAGVRILGVAASKKEALELVREMTQDCVDETGDADLRRFLEDED